MGEVILTMSGIDKSFPGVHALDHVDFELRRGEVHALMGENGAGKSTLMKVLTGIYSKDSGTITFEGQQYDYLFWEGVPHFEYDFYTGYCVKGSETESFLRDMLPKLGLNDAEMEEFLKFWLPDLERNPYNMISFQDRTYRNGAKLSVTPQPDTLIRVFMAWYPSDVYVKICPQIIETPERNGFTVVEWGGNKVR